SLHDALPIWWRAPAERRSRRPAREPPGSGRRWCPPASVAPNRTRTPARERRQMPQARASLLRHRGAHGGGGGRFGGAALTRFQAGGVREPPRFGSEDLGVAVLRVPLLLAGLRQVK